MSIIGFASNKSQVCFWTKASLVFCNMMHVECVEQHHSLVPNAQEKFHTEARTRRVLIATWSVHEKQSVLTGASLAKRVPSRGVSSAGSGRQRASPRVPSAAIPDVPAICGDGLRLFVVAVLSADPASVCGNKVHHIVVHILVYCGRFWRIDGLWLIFRLIREADGHTQVWSFPSAPVARNTRGAELALSSRPV